MNGEDRYQSARPARRSFLSRLIAGHLREWFIVGATIFAVGWIMINALFMQTGPHPAPIFANRPQAPVVVEPVKVLPRPRPAAIKADLSMPTLAAVPGATATPTRDAVGDLIGPNKRVAAVQRALAEYGYGQIKPTGTYDPATRNAIAEFERNRKLPVTGQLSERVTRELAAMTGRALD
jgi:hypothetical protein